jgi:hypothetical protein
MNPKLALSPMPVPTAWQFCPSRVPCSRHLVLRVQMHKLCVCPMLALHPQGPVFDLMCVPTVMHTKKVLSAK